MPKPRLEIALERSLFASRAVRNLGIGFNRSAFSFGSKQRLRV